MPRKKINPDQPRGVTPRQRELLELVAADLTIVQAAVHLDISKDAAFSLAAALRGRLQVRTMAGAVGVAIRAGLIA